MLTITEDKKMFTKKMQVIGGGSSWGLFCPVSHSENQKQNHSLINEIGEIKTYGILSRELQDILIRSWWLDCFSIESTNFKWLITNLV